MEGTPLRITWRLTEPWVPSAYGYHLDGVVAHVKVRRHIDEEEMPEDATDFNALTADLPFDRYIAEDGQWVWKASLLVADVQHSERRMLTAKTPIREIAFRTEEGVIAPGRSTIDIVRGYFKASLIYYPLEHVSSVTAYCVGDKERLVDYLSSLRGLGAKTRIGHGTIGQLAGNQFAIEEDDVALEAWKVRHMPDHHAGYAPIQGTLRTPYWRKDQYVMLYRPVDPSEQVRNAAGRFESTVS